MTEAEAKPGRAGLEQELAARDIWYGEARSVYRRHRFGILIGLQQDSGSGIVHNAEEVRHALSGHRGVKVLEATLYSAYLGRGPYKENAAVVLANNEAVVAALSGFAAQLHQESVPVVEDDRWTYTVPTAVQR